MNAKFFVAFVMVIALGFFGCTNDHPGSYSLGNNNNENCNQNNNNVPDGYDLSVSSSNKLVILTREDADGYNDFHSGTAPSGGEIEFSIDFTGPAAAIVTGSNTLNVASDDTVEVWKILDHARFDEVVEMEYTWAYWEPDLFPFYLADADDLEWMLSVFLCSDAGEMPELSPRACPPDFIPGEGEIVERVTTGYNYQWSNSGDDQVLFLVKR